MSERHAVGDTIYMRFTTRQFSSGAPYTLAGTPVVSAYENDSVTQITAGITLGVDHDSVTGLNLLTIVATGANGFEAGKSYDLVITTGTVDSVSAVGEVVGRFILGPEQVNVVEWLGTAAATPTTAGVPEVDVTYWLGGAVATPSVTGVPEVDITHSKGSSDTGWKMDAWFASIGPYGQADSGSTTTMVDASETGYGNDYWIGASILFRSGNNVRLARRITDYDSATGTFTFAPALPAAVGTTDYYMLFGHSYGGPVNTAGVPGADVTHWLGTAAATPNTAGIPKVDATLIEGVDATDQIGDAVWDELLTGATHNVANSAGRRLRNIQDFGIYDLASVWVDEVAGASTGTTAGEDATVANRANDFDNAQTVAAAVNLDRIHVQAGNSITLTATLNNYEVWGKLFTVALGGQDIGSCLFNGATISGIGTGTTPRFLDCLIGTATLPPALLNGCSLTATLTVGSAGDYRFVDCQSGVAGASAPVVDMGAAVGATTVEFRRWSGGLTLNNVAAGDVVTVDVVSGGTITVNGTGGTVVIRGMCNVVDGSSGSVSITQTSVVNMTKVNAEVDTAISDAALATAAALATVDTNVDAILVDTGTTIPGILGTPVGASLSADIAAIDVSGVAAAVMAAGDIDGYTLEESLKLILSGAAGDVTLVAPYTQATIEAADGSKTRITATVNSHGNRTVTARDATG